MAHPDRWHLRHQNYTRAMARLGEAVRLDRARPLSELEVQGMIQAYEFVFELAWNLLKDLLEAEGYQGVVGPRSVIREAYRRGLVSDGDLWLEMLRLRNLSSHSYEAGVADEVRAAIHDRCMAALQDLLEGAPSHAGGVTEGMPARIREELATILETEPAVLRATVFGSRARGNHRPGSDLDLLVEVAGPAGPVHRRLADAFEDSRLPWPVDLLVGPEGIPEELGARIRDEGMVVWARAPHQNEAPGTGMQGP
ncbi:MAG: HI0074 family nucleotidyltransferase substrate-binding subunit [Candidatus Sericytochromatia bacterium]|nr:HI0074 family nucleotidyltransferase substrate-binding subunit [Candidatus Sericytochromatia bacterium]